jgi:putative flippase GtrA
MLKRFIKFGVVGVVGFLVDAGVLLLLKPPLGPLYARPFSFLTALTTTFLLNRAFVFARDGAASPWRQFGAYFLANSIGGLANLGVYTALLAAHVTRDPIVALVFGSLAGYLANFMLSDRFVFRAKQNGPASPPGR